MPETPERRRGARLSVASHFGGEVSSARLLDLSSEGARVEHPGRPPGGRVCFVDLPPVLGRVRLIGRVVWTQLQGGEQTREGERRLIYQSGVAFVGVTPEQRTALEAALAILKTAENTPEGESRR